MSRILFDVSAPRPAARYLTQHSVEFADQRGWRELSNGDLVAAAEADGFDVMLTEDLNLRYRQNLSRRRIAIVALSTNHRGTLRGQIDRLVEAVARAGEGTYEEVTFPLPRRRGLTGQ